MSSTFVSPNYLIDYSQPASFNDYRPVVNASGTAAVFERNLFHVSADTNLYVLDLTGSTNQPSLFLQGASLPFTSNRPDWSWSTNQVAFSGTAGPPNSSPLQIGLANGNGSNPSMLASTEGMIYPTWFPDGATLAVYNDSNTAQPKPNTSTINTQGTLLAVDLAGPKLRAGMPSVNQANPSLVAFAGQPVRYGKYNQDRNYIWILDTSTGKVTPLETGCPQSGRFNPKYQGRAPWWSPDGSWIAFESNRSSSPDLYSIYLYKYDTDGPAIQITDPAYNMNHAKWFPQGFPGGPSGNPTLVVAAWQAGPPGQSPQAPWGLASLDVSTFVYPTR